MRLILPLTAMGWGPGEREREREREMDGGEGETKINTKTISKLLKAAGGRFFAISSGCWFPFIVIVILFACSSNTEPVYSEKKISKSQEQDADFDKLKNHQIHDNVLQKLRSIMTSDRTCTVYVSPTYKDRGSYSIRMWGISAETDIMHSSEWRKLYNVELALYAIREDGNERFYEQLYSDAERLYQLLYNNKEKREKMQTYF